MLREDKKPTHLNQLFRMELSLMPEAKALKVVSSKGKFAVDVNERILLGDAKEKFLFEPVVEKIIV